MLFYTYVLKSIKTGNLYKGHTRNLEKRVNQHNSGKTRSTKSATPWKLVYFETFKTRIEAIEREKYFKSTNGRRFLQDLKLDISILPPPNNQPEQ